MAAPNGPMTSRLHGNMDDLMSTEIKSLPVREPVCCRHSSSMSFPMEDTSVPAAGGTADTLSNSGMVTVVPRLDMLQ